VRILLDTSTFLWAAGLEDRLSKPAEMLFQDPETAMYLSAISISEIAIKHDKGKLSFGLHDALNAMDVLKIEALPYTLIHAQRLFGLPLHHKDPFDRQIIGQASAEGVPVVTVDPFFKLYEGVDVLW